MKTRTYAFMALASATFATMALVACSGDDTSSGNITLPRLDSGGGGNDATTGHNDATSGNDSSTGTDGTTGTDGNTGSDTGVDGGGDCGKVTSLFPEDGGQGPFCPFLPDGSVPKDHCALGSTCCHPSNTGPENCAATPAACAIPDGGGMFFQCDNSVQC